MEKTNKNIDIAMLSNFYYLIILLKKIIILF